jgi:hypothetical protein
MQGMLSNPAFQMPNMFGATIPPSYASQPVSQPPALATNKDCNSPQCVTINGDVNIVLTEKVMHELANLLSGAIERNP